jgi:hypothetical protein
MKDFSELADKTTIEETIKNLKQRNTNAFFVETGKDAKEKVLELLPKGSRVLAAQSQTLNKIGIADEIESSGNYVSIRKEYMSFDREKEEDKIRISRSIPDFIVGSINAITKQGEALIASNTGSQITAYAGGAGKVIWVIGAQKIVENLDEGFKRIYDYVLGLESERLKKLYGVGSNVSKLLIFDKEVVKDRVIIIFVNESLGY